MATANDPLFDETSDDSPINPEAGRGKAEKKGWFGRSKQWKPPAKAGRPPSRWRYLKFGLLAIFAIAILYYPIGMIVMHRIGDDVDFNKKVTVQKNGSAAIAVAAALIRREVIQHEWTPNDPFFYPSWMLDNLPNFQRGVMEAVSRFSIEMRDKVGRTRGSSSVDEDLKKAAGKLSVDTDQWWLRSAEGEYRRAIDALISYNKRLATGKAVFDRRADNLQALIDRVTSDIGSQSAAISQRVEQHGGTFFDTKSDNVYYRTKGLIYGYYIILTALGEDFKDVLKDRQADGIWTQMLHSLRIAAGLQPLIVRNGNADSMLMPNHLASLGFYLLRARTQLKEISDILLK